MVLLVKIKKGETMEGSINSEVQGILTNFVHDNRSFLVESDNNKITIISLVKCKLSNTIFSTKNTIINFDFMLLVVQTLLYHILLVKNNVV